MAASSTIEVSTHQPTRLTDRLFRTVHDVLLHAAPVLRVLLTGSRGQRLRIEVVVPFFVGGRSRSAAPLRRLGASSSEGWDGFGFLVMS
ncbi:hypothetical protein OHA79_06730 [Streptomyces sp. NBC_00841]|uniref:hypothetical protein n=1 Tax=unclassified Streptomyces TaxID=2593676 RepID=UPI0022595511|nr:MULTISPECIES: hypothetical protein [unclassified Streptomyces]MCX4537184.1 hypothetical protein [Streptomyces sp. NBC_01669]WRZ97583.1 hypothetical protein OHA79_06730 [Streptomyces sp. NBC_00841]